MFFAWIFLFIASILLHAEGLVISEIFANGANSSSDNGQEWFEVFNAGPEPINIQNMMVRRVDGPNFEEGFRFKVPGTHNLMVKPGQYFVISQSHDLGTGVCLNIPHAVIYDNIFSFPNSGQQALCVKPENQPEDCAQFSNSRVFPPGHSRYFSGTTAAGNDSLAHWQVEDCPLFFGAYATPGRPPAECRGNPHPFDDLVMHCPWSLGDLGHGPLLVFPQPKSSRLAEAGEIRVEFLEENRLALTLAIDNIDHIRSTFAEFYFALQETNIVGTQINAVRESGPQPRYLWNIRDLQPGKYFIFARVGDGLAPALRTKAIGPIEIKKTIPHSRFALTGVTRYLDQQVIVIKWTKGAEDGRVSFYWQDQQSARHPITMSAPNAGGDGELRWQPADNQSKISSIIGVFHSATGVSESILSVVAER